MVFKSITHGQRRRPLADAINLRLAHVLALLAAGRGPSDAAPKHLERLAWAALEVVEERRAGFQRGGLAGGGGRGEQ